MARAAGKSWIDITLYLTVAVVVVLAVFALFKSSSARQEVSKTFEGWENDSRGYEKLMAAQKQDGKPVLVYFYADWCPYCKNFTAKILSTETTREFLKRYPRVRIAPDNGAKEQALMSRFGAEGYPSFYVVLPGKAPIFVPVQNGPTLKTPGEFNRSVQEAAEPGAGLPVRE